MRAITGPEGSAWESLSNPHIQRQLPPDSHYYLVTGAHCDCHSGLVQHLYETDRTPRSLPRGGERWSASKQQRWKAQRAAVDAQRVADDDRRLSAWHRYLGQLTQVTAPGAVGLIAHFYSGSVDDESFLLTVDESTSIDELTLDAMKTWRADHLYRIMRVSAGAS